MKSNAQLIGSAVVALLAAGCGAEGLAPQLGASEHAVVRAAGSLRNPLTRSPARVSDGIASRVSLRDPAAVSCRAAGEAGAVLQVAPQQGANVPTKHTPRFTSKTPAVYMNALLVNVCGAHVATFDVYAPNGEFYARLSRPFNTSGEGVRASTSGHVVEMELPIAGTAIEANGMYGTYSVNFTLDGSGLAVGLGVFEIVSE